MISPTAAGAIVQYLALARSTGYDGPRSSFAALDRILIRRIPILLSMTQQTKQIVLPVIAISAMPTVVGVTMAGSLLRFTNPCPTSENISLTESVMNSLRAAVSIVSPDSHVVDRVEASRN